MQHKPYSSVKSNNHCNTAIAFILLNPTEVDFRITLPSFWYCSMRLFMTCTYSLRILTRNLGLGCWSVASIAWWLVGCQETLWRCSTHLMFPLCIVSCTGSIMSVAVSSGGVLLCRYDIVSPGETQKIAFARLFYHRPPFASRDKTACYHITCECPYVYSQNVGSFVSVHSQCVNTLACLLNRPHAHTTHTLIHACTLPCTHIYAYRMYHTYITHILMTHTPHMYPCHTHMHTHTHITHTHAHTYTHAHTLKHSNTQTHTFTLAHTHTHSSGWGLLFTQWEQWALLLHNPPAAGNHCHECGSQINSQKGRVILTTCSMPCLRITWAARGSHELPQEHMSWHELPQEHMSCLRSTWAASGAHELTWAATGAHELPQKHMSCHRQQLNW